MDLRKKVIDSLLGAQLRRHERLEDSEQFVGGIFGEAHESHSPVSLALCKALDIAEPEAPQDRSCCDCTHCECGR